MEKTYLFKINYLGKNYYFTNSNYNITVDNIDNSQPYIPTGIVFNSININIESAFIKDGGVENNKVDILVDNVEPFNLLSPIERNMVVEIYEFHQTPEINNYLIPRFKGIVTSYKLESQYLLTVSSVKYGLEVNIPLFVVSPFCIFQTYGPHCKVNKDNHKARINILEIVEKIAYFNINNYTTWSNRQDYLNTNNLGLNYTNGYIEQGQRIYSVEEQVTTNYSVVTTANNVFVITTEDYFVIGQKVLTSNNDYIAINDISTTSGTVTITTASNVGSINSITVETLRLKDDIDLTGNFWIYEGDNHSHDHCKLKFNNEARFTGCINIPDRNPVVTPVINIQE